jgi:AcrR family transcriptional regulator
MNSRRTQQAPPTTTTVDRRINEAAEMNMDPGASIAERSVQRTLANRRTAYSEEVARLIAAAVTVMKRSDAKNPTVSVSETVAEAGLSNQAFYRHFQSKDEFLLAIVDDGLRELLVYLEHEMAAATTPLEKILRWVEGVLAQSTYQGAAEPTRAVLANSSHLLYTHPEEFRRCEEVIEAPLRAALEQGVADGTLKPLDLDRDVTAIYRLIMDSMEASLARSQPPSERDIAHLVRVIYRALGVADADTISIAPRAHTTRPTPKARAKK